MKSLICAVALMGAVSTSALASPVPPIENGVWLSRQALPSAIEGGDFSTIRDLLAPDVVLTTDEGKIVVSGPEAVAQHLGRWYAGPSHVVSTYVGYASLLIAVERETDRPWDKAYTMVVTCKAGKISTIMIVQKNPNFASTKAKAPDGQ